MLANIAVQRDVKQVLSLRQDDLLCGPKTPAHPGAKFSSTTEHPTHLETPHLSQKPEASLRSEMDFAHGRTLLS